MINIPKGFYRVKTGQKVKIGDKYKHIFNNHTITTYSSTWKTITKMEFMSGGELALSDEIVIRRKKVGVRKLADDYCVRKEGCQWDDMSDAYVAGYKRGYQEGKRDGADI